MGFIGKAFAFVMFPLSILIVLEATGAFTLNLPFNKIFIGAILMIGLQLLTLIFVKAHHGHLSFMNIATCVIFMLPAAIYLLSSLFGNFLQTSIPLILGVMMFVEALYALH